MVKSAAGGFPGDHGGSDSFPGVTEALPAMFDLLFASPLRDLMVFDLGAGQSVGLDGSAVERVSTLCLQLLVAAAHAAHRSGLEFRLERPSAALAEAIADLGLTKELLADELSAGEN